MYFNTPVDATQWVCTNKKNVNSKCFSLFLKQKVYMYLTPVRDQNRISPKNINTIPSRSIFKIEVTVFYHTDRHLACK